MPRGFSYDVIEDFLLCFVHLDLVLMTFPKQLLFPQCLGALLSTAFLRAVFF